MKKVEVVKFKGAQKIKIYKIRKTKCTTFLTDS
jgi:hypothetical protein